jgi:hypothetical protein
MKDPFVRVVAILRWNFLRSVDFKVWYGWYVCICRIVMWWVWYNIPFGTFVYKCVGGCGLCFYYVVLWYLQVINSCFNCVYLGRCAKTVILVVNHVVNA